MNDDLVLQNICDGLSNQCRVRALQLILEGKASAAELRDRLQHKKSSLSQHMELLRRVGLVKKNKNGKNVVYELINRADVVVRAIMLARAAVAGARKEGGEG